MECHGISTILVLQHYLKSYVSNRRVLTQPYEGSSGVGFCPRPHGAKRADFAIRHRNAPRPLRGSRQKHPTAGPHSVLVRSLAAALLGLGLHTVQITPSSVLPRRCLRGPYSAAYNRTPLVGDCTRHLTRLPEQLRTLPQAFSFPRLPQPFFGEVHRKFELRSNQPRTNL